MSKPEHELLTDFFSNFDARTENALRREGITNHYALIARTRSDLFRIPNLGKGSVEKIESVLSAHGLQLAETSKRVSLKVSVPQAVRDDLVISAHQAGRSLDFEATVRLAPRTQTEASIEAHPSIGLRDYFAAEADVGPEGIGIVLAKALMGGEPASASPEDPLANFRWWEEAVARWRYMHADAMLKARTA